MAHPQTPSDPQYPDRQTDPQVVATHCEETARGVDQQAVVAGGGTGMGGHPYPAVFLAGVAQTLRDAATVIRSLTPDPLDAIREVASAGRPLIDVLTESPAPTAPAIAPPSKPAEQPGKRR